MIELIPAQADVAVLLPTVTDWERTKVRYGGLAEELISRGVTVVFAESHDSYQGEGVFRDTLRPIDPRLGSIAAFVGEKSVKPKVLRDLTMPTGPKPLYTDESGPVLVHHPTINELLISKSGVYDLMREMQPFSISHVKNEDIEEAVASMPGRKVVIKPDTGMAGQGVIIGSKSEAVAAYIAEPHKGLSIVQDAVDMSSGLEEHKVKGVHNVRFIAIGGTAVFGFVRNDESGSMTMQGETFEHRNFLLPEDFQDGLLSVLSSSQKQFATLPHSAETIVAFDLMRGVDYTGESREFLLEVNRRPLRNSPYDGSSTNTLWASQEWDKAEAALLARVVKSVPNR
ncbi:hypothetical protein BH10PAT3_BH10PAT3_1490 [soil metagenome]